MYIDAKRLDWSGITQNDLVQDKKIKNVYTLNFGKVRNGEGLWTHESIALGTVTLINIGGNRFKILTDRYDHDIKPGKENAKRNAYTLLLNNFNTLVGDNLSNGILAGINAYYIAIGKPGQYGFDIHFYHDIITLPDK